MPKQLKSTKNEVTTTTLDMEVDVSDNNRLFRAITKNVASMVESVSMQICEFEDKILESMDVVKADFQEKLADHGGQVQSLMTAVRSMPDQGRIVDGVHSLLGRRLEDGHGKIMNEIKSLPLEKSFHVMVQAIENMEENVLGSTLEAIELLKKDMAEKAAQENKHLLFKIQSTLPDRLDRQDVVDKVCMAEIKELRREVVDTRAQLSSSIKKSLDSVLDDHSDGHKSISREIRTLTNQVDTLLKQTDQSNVQVWLDDHSKALHDKLEDHARGINFKLDSHGKKQDDVVKMMRDMPDHDTIMKGVHGLMADHMNEHSGKIVSEIKKIPVPPDEKRTLNAIENMQEAVLGDVLGAIEGLKADLEGHTKSLHSKFVDHGHRSDDIMASLERMPNHDTMMKGVHSLLREHLGDIHDKIAGEIQKLPFKQHEKGLLQAVENMQEETTKSCTAEMKELQKELVETRSQLNTSIKKSLDSILNGHSDGHKSMSSEMRTLNKQLDTLLKQTDQSKIKSWLDDHSKTLHGKLDDHEKGVHLKLDSHGKKHDDAVKIMRDMPDHDTLMKGVHGLMADHMNDHGGKIMSEINKMPLPPDEKLMLNTIENMQEAVLGEVLGAIQGLKADLEGHTKSLHGKFDDHGRRSDDIMSALDGIPNHDAVLEGVHGLLGKHLGDSHGKITSEIKLPLDQHEKLLLQAVENMEETVLATVMDGMESLRRDLSKGDTHDILKRILSSLPDGLEEQMKALQEDTKKACTAEMKDIRKEVVETRGQLTSSIKKSLDSILSGHSDGHKSISNDVRTLNKQLDTLSKQTDQSKIKCWLDDHSKAMKGTLDEHSKHLHGKLDGHSKKLEDLGKMLNAVPDHASLMKGVHGLIGDALADHSGKLTKEIKGLPSPPDEKVVLQAIENMQEAVLSETLDAIAKFKADLEYPLEGLHGKFEDHSKRVNDLMATMDKMPDHEAFLQGVHGLLGEHLGDGHGKIMDEIKSLPLDQSQKVMLQAVENMEESVLAATMEAIEGLRKEIMSHSDALQGRNFDELTKLLDSMPDHNTLLKGVSSMLGDGHGKLMDEIKALPLDRNQTVMLQAFEKMEESVLTNVLQAIENIQMNISVQGIRFSADNPAPPPMISCAADATRSGEVAKTSDSPGFSSSSYPTRAGAPVDRRASSSYATKRWDSTTETSSSYASKKLDSTTEPKRRIDSTAAPAAPTAYPSSYKSAWSSCLVCKCGFTCGTSTALSRHLDRNTGKDHGQVLDAPDRPLCI